MDERARTESGRRVVVAADDAPASRVVDLPASSALIVCVEGPCARVRLSLDGVVAVDRDATPDERSARRVEVTLAERALKRWTEHATVLVDVRALEAEHFRGGSDAAPWRAVATLVVRGSRANVVVATCMFVLGFVGVYWLLQRTSAGSTARRLWDLASMLSVVPGFVFAAGVGGARAPRLLVGWLAVVAMVSLVSLANTTSVIALPRSDLWLLRVGAPVKVVRYTRGELAVRGDGRVTISGRAMWVSREKVPLSRWGFAALVTRRLLATDEPSMRQIERSVADALSISRDAQVAMDDPRWVAIGLTDPVELPPLLEREGYAFPRVFVRQGPPVRAADLGLGTAGPIHVVGLGGANSITLRPRAVPDFSVSFDLADGRAGLSLPRLGSGWSGERTPNPMRSPHVDRFDCDPGANTIAALVGDGAIVERIEGARYAATFEGHHVVLVCFDDDGTSFSNTSSVTIVVRADIGHEDAWHRLAPELLREWRTIRLVDRSRGRDELLAVTTRPEATAPADAEVLAAALGESLADATEIAVVSNGARTVLWRRSAARRTVVLLNVLRADRPQSPREFVVRIGEGPASREARAALVRARAANVLREVASQ